MAITAVAQVHDDMPQLTQLRSKCSTLLQGIASSGHSDMEVAAFCRAAYPVEMCRTMRSALGSQPWQPARIDSTCKGFEDRVLPELLSMTPERRAISLGDIDTLRDGLEQSAEAKRTVGYNMPTNPDGSVDLEETAKQKYMHTQQATSLWNKYWSPERKFEEGRVSKSEEGWGLPLRAVAALSLAAVAAVGGAALVVKRAAKGRAQLLQNEEA